MAIKQQMQLCWIWGGEALVAAEGRCGKSAMMLMIEAVGNGGGVQVKGFGGGGQGERNG